MSEESEKRSPAEETEAEEEQVRDWIRGAMKDAPEAPVDVLGGVQQKLRERSGGKFYADFWSTAKAPPAATLLGTGAIMLAIVIAAFSILFSLSGHIEKVKMEPAPVDILPAPN